MITGALNDHLVPTGTVGVPALKQALSTEYRYIIDFKNLAIIALL
jgi:hypothetical protein